MSSQSRLSDIVIIVPVKDEEESIEHFVREFTIRVNAAVANFSFLFVDDGSTDATINVLKRLSVRDPRINYLKLSRNFGKEAAMTAGIDHVHCDAAIIMDVDLQDPPEIIPHFIKYWKQGFDTVYGARATRFDDSYSRRIFAKLFYRAFNVATFIPIPENAGDFRLISGRLIEVLRNLPERNRFMKGLFAWPGFSTIGVPYERPARARGTTKFNIWKLWNFALEGLSSFSTMPLRIWTYIGTGIALLSFFYVIQIIVKWLIFGSTTAGYSSIMCAVLLFGGIQLISIGVLGEYIGRMYIEAKHRPIYVVEEVSQFAHAAFETSLTRVSNGS